MEQKEKHSRQIVRDILRQIGCGTLNVNDTLPSERELARLYHVSRSSVREAMQVLEVIGIVQIRPKEKTRITSFQMEPFIRMMAPLLTVKEELVADIAEFRMAVEVRAAMLAARRADAKELQTIVEAMKRCTQEEQARQLDLQFHQALVRASGNELLVIALDSVGSLMRSSVNDNRRFRMQSLSPAVLVCQHQQLCTAIRKGQVRQAGALMEAHLNLKKEEEEDQRENCGVCEAGSGNPAGGSGSANRRAAARRH